MNISLPPALREWVEQEVASRGLGSASEFVRDLIRRERETSLRARVDQTLLEALKTPSSEMTDDDWADIQMSAHDER